MVQMIYKTIHGIFFMCDLRQLLYVLISCLKSLPYMQDTLCRFSCEICHVIFEFYFYFMENIDYFYTSNYENFIEQVIEMEKTEIMRRKIKLHVTYSLRKGS